LEFGANRSARPSRPPGRRRRRQPGGPLSGNRRPPPLAAAASPFAHLLAPTLSFAFGLDSSSAQRGHRHVRVSPPRPGV